jgi:hypothetical protein
MVALRRLRRRCFGLCCYAASLPRCVMVTLVTVRQAVSVAWDSYATSQLRRFGVTLRPLLLLL